MRLMKRDWEDLTATSYQDTVVEIKEAPDERDHAEVEQGLNALLESLSQESKFALKSQLVCLMMHVIKWHIQPEKRSGRWALSIEDAREQIEYPMEAKPSLNRRFLETIWEDSFRKAEVETQKRNTVPGLEWETVFSLPTKD